MESFETEILIQAPAEQVWDVLTAVEAWPKWSSGVLDVKGRAGPGESIKLVSEANPKRAFSLKVAKLDRPHSMVWVGGMPLGLFRGERSFSLRPEGADTLFRMREQYTGPLLPLIWRSMPDLRPSFDKFASGLKTQAESNR
jgi:hypothetical protein